MSDLFSIKNEIYNWDEFYSDNESDQPRDELNVRLDSNWGYLVLEPDFFLDSDMGCLGFDVLREIEGCKAANDITFVLTEFDEQKELSPIWSEPYSSSSIAESDNSSWQFAMSGLFFFPENRNWFALYVDSRKRDFIVFCAPMNVIFGNLKFMVSDYLLDASDYL